MSENEKPTYTLENGRVIELQPLSEHFFIFYGTLPGNLTAKAADALQKGDRDAYAEDFMQNANVQQRAKTIVMMREAVKAVCAKPRLVLEPQNQDEFAPSELSIKDFDYLSKWAFASAGGAAQGLETFRHG